MTLPEGPHAYDVVVAGRAEEDLASIWQLVASESATSADRLMSELRDAIDSLRLFPHRGMPVRSSRHAGARAVFVRRRWMVLYRVQQDRVEVLRVVGGRRDIEALDHGT